MLAYQPIGAIPKIIVAAALLENRYNQLTTQATLYQALGGSDIAPPLADN
ncbi:hypothetical protein [Shewanella sp. MR-4]|nr:hypothetical protein [Shewanella sp. MR-4]